MSRYEITVKPDDIIEEFQVTLRGPGLNTSGRHYVFRNPHRAEAFAETVNFAYQQGLRDGARNAILDGSRELVVAGRTPDDIHIKPESWWLRMRRLMLIWACRLLDPSTHN